MKTPKNKENTKSPNQVKSKTTKLDKDKKEVNINKKTKSKLDIKEEKPKKETPKIQKSSRIKDITKRIDDFPFDKPLFSLNEEKKEKEDINKATKIEFINAFVNVESHEEFIKRVEDKCDRIKEDLQNQLINQGKFGGHFDHEVENYVFLAREIESFKRDIQVNGNKYRESNGNGIIVIKTNDAILNLLKFEQQALAILNCLDLKAPDVGDTEDNDLY